jgi:hypothetical protein
MYIGWVGLLFWSFNVECFLSTVACQSHIFQSYHQGLGSFGVEANTLPTFQTGRANLHWPINTYKDRLTKYSFKCKYFNTLSTHPICLWRFFMYKYLIPAAFWYLIHSTQLLCMLWHVGPRVLFLELPFWQAMQHYMVYISFLSSGCGASPLCISSWISLPLRIDTKDQMLSILWISLPLRIDTKDQMLSILSFLVPDFQHGYQEVSGVVLHSSLVMNHLLYATYSHDALSWGSTKPCIFGMKHLNSMKVSSHGLW